MVQSSGLGLTVGAITYAPFPLVRPRDMITPNIKEGYEVWSSCELGGKENSFGEYLARLCCAWIQLQAEKN